jgi:hypothetical protein
VDDHLKQVQLTSPRHQTDIGGAAGVRLKARSLAAMLDAVLQLVTLQMAPYDAPSPRAARRCGQPLDDVMAALKQEQP